MTQGDPPTGDPVGLDHVPAGSAGLAAGPDESAAFPVVGPLGGLGPVERTKTPRPAPDGAGARCGLRFGVLLVLEASTETFFHLL
jgi:hypothetical protein